MERNEVIVSEQELARQKEFTRKMREMNDRRTRTPLALVDTFGCQQNVADGEVLMGMLREMGYDVGLDENVINKTADFFKSVRADFLGRNQCVESAAQSAAQRRSA